MSGDHRPDDRGSAQIDPRTAEEWIAHISLFVDQQKELRRRDSLSPEAIGALDGAGRLIFQRQASIEGICRLMRERPRADCTVAVYLIVVTYCDNNTGRTTISMPRLARLLARHEDNIRNAIATLVEVGLIGVEAPPGRPRRYWPISHRALANRMGSITWFLDALAPAVSPDPRRAPPETVGNVVPLATPAHERGIVSTRGARENGGGVYAAKGGVSTQTESSIEFSVVEASEGGATTDFTVREATADFSIPASEIVALVSSDKLPTDRQLQQIGDCAVAWTRQKGDRQFAEASLTSFIAGKMEAIPANRVREILDVALVRVEAVTKGFIRRPDFPAFVKYYTDAFARAQTLAEESAAKVAAAQATAIIDVRTEQQISQQRIAAHQKAIDDGAQRRCSPDARTKADMDWGNFRRTHLEGKFEDEKQYAYIKRHQIKGLHCNQLLQDVPGSTKSDVSATLVDISDSFGSPRTETTLKEVLRRADHELRRKVAYRQHGEPIALAGGNAAVVLNLALKSDYFAVSRETWQSWQELYPLALSHDRDPESSSDESEYYSRTAIDEVWRDVVVSLKTENYGTSLQAEGETEFARLLKLRHDKAVELRAEKAAWNRDVRAVLLERINFAGPVPPDKIEDELSRLRHSLSGSLWHLVGEWRRNQTSLTEAPQ